MKNTTIQTSISEEKKEALKQNAKDRGVNTLQALMSVIIDDYIKKNKLM